jgi:hypothetical protein
LGRLQFLGKNDASEDVTYASIDTIIQDASDGTEDAQVRFRSITAGTTANRMEFTGAETVFNESSKDLDFRVESDGASHMLFVDAGNNRVGIGEASPDTMLHATTSSSTEGFKIESTAAGATAGPFLKLDRNSSSPADDDGLGYLDFDGRNSAGETLTYTTFRATLEDEADGSEDGGFFLSTKVAGTTRSRISGNATETVFNEDSVDLDFRVESDGNTHALFVNSGSDAVGMGATASLVNAASSEGLFYSIGGSLTVASNTETLQINRNSTGGNNRANIGLYNNGTLRGVIGTLGGQDGIYFQSGGDVDNLQLQDGTVVFNESSADIDFRVESDDNTHMLFLDANDNRVYVGGSTNVNTSALQVTAQAAQSAIVSKVVDNLYSVFQSFNASGDLLTQITGAGVLTHNGSAVITTADNTTTLNLVSTDTDANAGPHLRLSRNATGADSDALGQVEFSGRDDAGNDFIYAQIEAYIVDASNGSEDGYLEIFRGVGGTERVSGMILSSTDTVFNENSADIDFRVESNGNANMLFVDANTDCVGIATSSPSTSGAALVVQANAAAAAIDVVGRSNGGIASMSFYDDNGTSLVGYIQGRADDNEYRFWTTTSDIISLGQNNTERARFEDSGVVFNEGSNDYDFRVESNNDTHALFLDAGNDRVIVGASASTAGTDFVSFDAAPGTTGQLIQCGRDSTDTKNQVIFTNPNGTVGSIQTASSATSYNTSSDARLKENIADADDAGALVDAIQVRQFDWIADGEHQRYGMVAQELNTVAPEAVSAPEDPDEMMGVDYSKLVPMLVKEIQSLRARVAQLENT